MKRITVAPVTRVEGHLGVTLDLDGSGRVASAYASGTMFRGFERIMVGRDPRDAIHLTQRICGVCPVPHARVSVEAVERAFGVEVSRNAVLLRNLVQGADLVSNHLLHFYQLALLDYVHGPAMPPFTPAPAIDQRFSEADAQVFADHYIQALEMRRAAQEAGALFAGKLPHVMTFAPGGVTQQPTSQNVADCGRILDRLIPFIEGIYIPDVLKVSRAYPEYLALGGGPPDLLSFGAFPDGAGGQLFFAGRYLGYDPEPKPGNAGQSPGPARHNAALPLTDNDIASIGESVKHAYYGDRPGSDPTVPNLDKRDAYSWVKAPRLDGAVYQVGALARMIISGYYQGGLSAMDRLLANAYETAQVAAGMRGWLAALSLDASGYRPVSTMPRAGKAVALTEAARGALAHWLEYADGKVTGYRIITPTSWNASPRDEREEPGPLEQALVGVPVADRSAPIEVYRVIHSFDPCMGCAVHMTVVP